MKLLTFQECRIVLKNSEKVYLLHCAHRLIGSFGWKKLLRSSSLTASLTLPSPHITLKNHRLTTCLSCSCLFHDLHQLMVPQLGEAEVSHCISVLSNSFPSAKICPVALSTAQFSKPLSNSTSPPGSSSRH